MGENKREIHLLKPACMPGTVETSGRSVEEVVTFINGFDETRIEQAATAYNDAHTAVTTAKNGLEAQARKLAEVWEGPASVEAQQALGILYVTLGELADKLKKMAEPISALATVVSKHKSFVNDGWKGIMPTWANQGGLTGGSWNDSIADLYSVYTGVYGGDSATGDWGSQDELAGLHLQTFGDDLSHVHVMIPDTVEKVLRDIHPPQLPQEDPDPIDYSQFNGDTGGLTPASYGNTDMSGMPTGGPGTGGPSFGALDPSTDPSTPNIPGYPGTNPPGYPPTDSPTGPDSNGQDPNGQNPDGQNPNGRDPNGQNPGGQYPNGQYPNGQNPGSGTNTNLQDYRPTTASTVPTGTVPTTNSYGSPTSSFGPGTSGGVYGGGGGMMPAGGAPGVGATRGGGTGMPFLPMGGMGGAGAGQESQDRESSTWLHEDDDVWGGDSDSVVNDRIG
ncbi:WXG100 family type VII secretion target [Nonomuraea sp. NPDC049709]|uniref:WXG100 family type VII secretion target n=1 Tax=Nonomuraea sp. NPDC049709 TaxID=3154736 RepID=UPI00341F8EC1